MVELNDFIQIHDDALQSNLCDYLTSVFEEFEDKQEKVDHNGKPTFTQFNVTEHKGLTIDLAAIHDHLIEKTFYYRNLYYDFVDKRVFPESHAFEQFRIKRYNPGGEDRFDTHVDVLDYASSRRFLAFMWYLNDVEEGGETIFVDGLVIKPKKGTLVVFPPLWLYPHRGEPPVSSSKYILSTYLHYK